MLRSLAFGLVVVIVFACQVTAPAATTAVPTTAVFTTASSPASIAPVSGLPFVALADLPPEAADTVALIETGGPFPYDQDGAVFENREAILPDQPSGYYHEYTVETPGSDDRGARRIVTGSEGEMYWTDDHYDSFSRIAT